MLRWLYSLWLHVPALKVMGHDRRNRPCHTRTQPRNTRSIVKWYILSSLRRGFEGLRALLPPCYCRTVCLPPVMREHQSGRLVRAYPRPAAPLSRPIFPRSRSSRGCFPRDHARTQPGPAAWPHTAWPRSLAHAARFQACRPAGTSPARFLRRPYARAQVRKWHGLAPGSGFTCLVK